MQYLEILNISILILMIILIFVIGKLYNERYSIKKMLKNYENITKFSEIISRNSFNEEINSKDILTVIKVVTFSELSSKMEMNNVDKINFKEVERKFGKNFAKEIKLFIIELKNKEKLTKEELDNILLKYYRLLGDNHERN